MARFGVVLSVCVIALGSNVVRADDPVLDKGVEMSNRAMRGACWYEYLKQLPKAPETNANKFGNCYSMLDMSSMQKQMADQGFTGEDAAKYIGQFMVDTLKQQLPTYSDCSSYLNDPKKMSTDMSSVLKDGSDSYLFKGFANCMVAKVKDMHGKDGTSALEQRFKYGENAPWAQILNDRENENRARHGAGPLKLDAELTTRAQRWADNLAANCAPLSLSDHISEDNPDYKYKDQATGENLAQNSGTFMSPDNALAAANSWYEEVRDYPWPAYNGDGNDDQFGKIGHFTAQVWKGSQLSGYGLGRREGCDKVYVVGRYWPGGNMIAPGSFASNVGAFQG